MDVVMRCPFCRARVDTSYEIDPRSGIVTQGIPPGRGELSVCGCCAEIAVHAAGPRLRPLTSEEFGRLAADDVAWKLIEDAQRYVQGRSPHYDHERRRN